MATDCVVRAQKQKPPVGELTALATQGVWTVVKVALHHAKGCVVAHMSPLAVY
jgi:hypothetical protein